MHSKYWALALLQCAATGAAQDVRRQDGNGEFAPQSWTTIITTETLSNSTTTMTTTSSLSIPEPETTSEPEPTTEAEPTTSSTSSTPTPTPSTSSTPTPTPSSSSTPTPTPSTSSTPTPTPSTSSTPTPSTSSKSSSTPHSTTTPFSSSELLTSTESNSTVPTTTSSTSSSSTPSASLRCGKDKGSFMSTPAKKLQVTNLDSCKSSCKDDDNCKSFEYGTLDGSGNNCWFFEKPVEELEIGDPQKGFTWSFWDRDCEETTQCGLEGSYLTKPTTKTQVSDVEACKAACQKDSSCQSFEFGTTDYSDNNCWLFSKAMWEMETTQPQVGFVWRFYDRDCSVSE